MNWIRAYEMYMLTLLFLLPVVVMAMAYSIIAVKVWRVSAMRRTGGYDNHYFNLCNILHRQKDKEWTKVC